MVLLGMMLVPVAAMAATGARTDGDIIHTALRVACATSSLQSSAIATAFAAADPGPPQAIEIRGRRVGERTRITIPHRQIIVEHLARNESLATVRVFIHDSEDRPRLFVATDPQCRIHIARRIEYDQTGHARALQTLDGDLTPMGEAEPLDPPLPPGNDPGGVRVAMVDSGVNYLLPLIAHQLARDKNGDLIGFDFWDMDPRPFDSHPVPSVFFTQRHGTRTAALVLIEAPHTSLVTYRYPRPDMSRMRQLIEHAKQHEIRIVGLPLGGNRESLWRVFAETARAHPDILFVASAGNSGRDIDQAPVYPAVLKLSNLLVVGSADDQIRPAEGTNWGADSVHILVPAEQRVTLDFDGRTRTVSGSSYAVSRLVALAARLAHDNPDWRAPQLRAALVERALPLPHLEKYVSAGYLPDPLARPGEVIKTRQQPLRTRPEDTDLELPMDLIWLQGSGWDVSVIEKMVQRAGEILKQCGVGLGPVTLHEYQVPARLLDFDVHTAHTLIDQQSTTKPSVYLVRDTNRQSNFEGEAFGKGNTQTRPWLTNTVWLVAGIHEPALALAHELFHVISNSGAHSGVDANLMNVRTRATATRLDAQQCGLFRKNGLAEKLLISRNTK